MCRLNTGPIGEAYSQLLDYLVICKLRTCSIKGV